MRRYRSNTDVRVEALMKQEHPELWARLMKERAAATRQRYRLGFPCPPQRITARVDKIFHHLLRYYGSAHRPQVLLQILQRSECAEIFWRAFDRAWSVVDASWSYHQEFLALLRRHLPERKFSYLSSNNRPLLETLPTIATVYRGCSADRVHGIAWTLDPGVAECFARGHRGIPVQNAVIAEAQIPREAVFAAFAEREESEVVLDPSYLKNLRWNNVSRQQV